MLLRLISSTGAYDTDWGSDLGLIVWDWAQTCGFSLKRDLRLVGSCALMSTDTLVSQIISAVCSNSIEQLNYCVTDRRLRDQVRYSGPVNVLLHLAVKHHAIDVFSALIRAGFDPYTYNHEGDLPIHLCERYGNLRGFEVFKYLGVSLTSQDQNGYSVLHHWAQDRPLNYEFVNRIFELDSQEVIEGLQERTTQGQTPLTMAFGSAGESQKSEHRDLDLNKLCLQILGLLKKQHIENGVEISLATEANVDSLKESFPEFGGMIRSEPTPLHKLKAGVSASQV